MAKKKDPTRNPPSWLEKGLFISVIVIIIAIAFPIFWRLNQTTREFYACVSLQQELEECIIQWKEENNITSALVKIPEDELRARYGKAFPTCPVVNKDGTITELVKIDKSGCSISCTKHKYQEYVVKTSDDANK